MDEVKTPKKPLLTFYAIAMIVLMLINLIGIPMMNKRQIQDVDYGTFMRMTENSEIGKVQILSNKIIFTDKEDSVIYETGLMNDYSLVQRLYDSGAQFSGEII